MQKILNIIIFNILILTFSTQAHSIDLKKIIKPEKGKPILIDADSLMLKDKDNLAIFKKNVLVKQGQMVLKADEVKVYSEDILGKKRSKIKKIEAFGDVKFSSMGKTAEANNAHYDVAKGKVTLKNKVRLEEDGNTLEGSNFIYNVNTGRSSISGSKKVVDGKTKKSRVKATLTPEESDKDIKIPLSPIEDINRSLRQR